MLVDALLIQTQKVGNQVIQHSMTILETLTLGRDMQNHFFIYEYVNSLCLRFVYFVGETIIASRVCIISEPATRPDYLLAKLI